MMIRSREDAGAFPDHVMHAVRVLCGEELDESTLVTGIPHRGGRPPTGTRVEDGMLRAGPNFNTVRRTLQKVRDGRVSKADAARQIDVSRKTVDNLLEREDLYRLD